MPTRTMLRITALIALTVPALGSARGQETDDVEAIRRVLADQQEAWNRGDYEGFMEGYWKSDSLTFASAGTFNRGWQTTLDNYMIRYPERSTMGELTFTLYETRLLSDTDAFVFGRYDLARKTDQPTGVFTLLFRKFETGWKIVFDHTSSAPTNRE